MLSIPEVKAAGGYPIIYADPPWSYNDRGCNGAAEKQYKTMSPEEIRALPVREIAAPDAVLFLWATYPKLPEALALMPAWGFEFVSIAFQWIKYRGQAPFLGLGRWTRGNTEPVLLAKRGKPERISKAVSQLITSNRPIDDEIFEGQLSRHSAKPAEVRDRIVALMGDLPRIELFARLRPAGWDVWGNDPALQGNDVMLTQADLLASLRPRAA